MALGLVALLGLIGLTVAQRGSFQIADLFASPTPTPFPTDTLTPTATLTATATATSTVTPTATNTATRTPLPTNTATPSPTITPTPLVSSTPTATNTLVLSPTPTLLVETGPNLLSNSGFEEGTYVNNNDGDQRVPNGWQPWWLSAVVDQCFNFKPHYELEMHPPHVHSGTSSARYYTGYASHNGGLFQQAIVTPGQSYQFSIYGFAWSTNEPVVDSPSTASAQLWIGIDPSGGTSAGSNLIVWSPGVAQMDSYGQFIIRATATASRMTVFTRTRPDTCVARNDSFWDDASLRQLGSP